MFRSIYFAIAHIRSIYIRSSNFGYAWKFVYGKLVVAEQINRKETWYWLNIEPEKQRDDKWKRQNDKKELTKWQWLVKLRNEENILSISGYSISNKMKIKSLISTFEATNRWALNTAQIGILLIIIFSMATNSFINLKMKYPSPILSHSNVCYST